MNLIRRTPMPLLFLLALGFATSCASAQAERIEATQGSHEEALDDAANSYIAQAQALEPATTARLQALAKARGGEMYKLEYRFKSKKSLLRKVNKILKENPEFTLADVRIDDALRYTMLFPDEPPGNHNQAIHDTLKALTEDGHGVVKVKNYWPRGDGYSGVNSVLVGPNGLLWELQFQTPLSAETNGKTRHMYEELRKVDTTIERKRELFDQMTAFWDLVPIPEGILEPGSLHETEQIKDRPRP